MHPRTRTRAVLIMLHSVTLLEADVLAVFATTMFTTSAVLSDLEHNNVLTISCYACLSESVDFYA